MIRIQQIKINLEHRKDDLEKEILRILGIKKEICEGLEYVGILH